MQGLGLDTALSPTASLNHASAAEPLSGLHETLIRKQDRFLFSRFFLYFRCMNYATTEPSKPFKYTMTPVYET